MTNLFVPGTGTIHRGARCGAATLLMAPAGNRRMTYFSRLDPPEVESLLESGHAHLCKSCEKAAVAS